MTPKSFLELTRLNHGILVAIAVAVGAIIVEQGLPDLLILGVAMLVGICIQAGSFTIGDYWDIKTDKANKRYDRPLARGDIKPATAYHLAVVLFVVGLLLSLWISEIAFIIAFIFTIVGVAYGYTFKKIALIGNMFTASSMAIPFIFGAIVFSDTIPLGIWMLAFMAFFAGTGREILKGIQDVKGDKKTGRKTLPILIGKKGALRVATIFIITAVLISLYPFLYIDIYKMDLYYGIFIGIADLLSVSTIVLAEKDKHKKGRKLGLFAMLASLIGFLLGAIL